MDEIRRLISQFENAVRQYDSCQPHATDKWRADLVRHRKWDLQIIAELQRRFAPLSRRAAVTVRSRRALSKGYHMSAV
jgi:hypothetical protein